MVPPDRSETADGAATIPQGYKLPSNIPKPAMNTAVEPTVDPTTIEGVQSGLYPGTLNTKSSMPVPKKATKQTYPAYGDKSVPVVN